VADPVFWVGHDCMMAVGRERLTLTAKVRYVAYR
jgi:hypothetical protein